MIEKRFKLGVDEQYGAILGNDKIMRKDEIVELLNEQHETIQRLKQNIDELLSVNVEEELLKENEQLKRQIGNFEHTKDFVADVCADCKRLEKEKEQLNKSRDELISENRHIKKTIQTMLINERTAIGKSVLKQLWNAIHME